jgi:hypothetical protein
MSKGVTVTKNIDIDVQVDFVECSNCGKELEFTLDADDFGDLRITVDKCDCNDDE